MQRLLAAMAFAHSRNAVHRDIKPSNVMITGDGEAPSVKIMDFGIAKILDDPEFARHTHHEAVMYTRGYSSPEQLRAPSTCDQRADIYSLGVTLYEMLTGRLPFEAETDLAYQEAVCYSDAPDPRRFRPDLSERLAQVVLKAIHRNREQRFQSCEEFWVALYQAKSSLRDDHDFEQKRRTASSPSRPLALPKPQEPPGPSKQLSPSASRPIASSSPLPPPAPPASSSLLWLVGLSTGVALAVLILLALARPNGNGDNGGPPPPPPPTIMVVLSRPGFVQMVGPSGPIDPDEGLGKAQTVYRFTGVAPGEQMIEAWSGRARQRYLIEVQEGTGAKQRPYYVTLQ